MSTASAPSRFWGVVAIALNSVLQPAGQICGGTESPALRLSPPFQIANAISLIYHSVRLSFAVGLPFRTALGVISDRARLYEKRSGKKEPERHFYFRLSVFVFGALPTLVKALAIQGDRVSSLLVLGYFVPFLVLESIELLREKPNIERLAEALRMPEKMNTDVIIFRLMMDFLALALHIELCLQALSLALMKSIFEATPSKMNGIIRGFSPIVAITIPISLKVYEKAPKDKRSPLVILILFVGSVLLLLKTTLESINMWGRWFEIATTILSIAFFTTGTLAHLLVYLRFTSTKLCQLFSGEDRHTRKFMEQWIALWTVACIILYYGYLYDASGTYKPAWTEWLP